MVARTRLDVTLYVHYMLLRLTLHPTSLSLSLSLCLFSSVFGVLLLHKPIPCCGTRRSTPTVPQDHRLNPNQATDVYSCLLTSPLVVTINNVPVHHTTGLLACQKYPLPQYYHSVSWHELMRQNFLLPTPHTIHLLTYLLHVTQTFIRT